jgi:hypothetical protein
VRRHRLRGATAGLLRRVTRHLPGGLPDDRWIASDVSPGGEDDHWDGIA